MAKGERVLKSRKNLRHAFPPGTSIRWRRQETGPCRKAEFSLRLGVNRAFTVAGMGNHYPLPRRPKVTQAASGEGEITMSFRFQPVYVTSFLRRHRRRRRRPAGPATSGSLAPRHRQFLREQVMVNPADRPKLAALVVRFNFHDLLISTY